MNPVHKVRYVDIDVNRHQWTERTSSDPTNLVGAQLKLVTSLAESLGLAWDRERRAAVRTRLENAIRAYELVQRARRSWGDRRENFTTQIDGYSQGIALDPDFLSAHLELAYVYRNMSDNLLPARLAHRDLPPQTTNLRSERGNDHERASVNWLRVGEHLSRPDFHLSLLGRGSFAAGGFGGGRFRSRNATVPEGSVAAGSRARRRSDGSDPYRAGFHPAPDVPQRGMQRRAKALALARTSCLPGRLRD